MDKEATIIDDKQIIIDKSDLDFIHKQYKDKITNLESKLAESENKVYELQTKLNLKEYAPAFCSLAGRDCEILGKVDQLKQQLAEKDQAIEGLQEINQSLGQTCNNDAKEIERLREQLAEKEKEETKRMEDFEKRCQEYYSTDEYKRDFAIAELEKVKDYIRKFVGINDVKFICTTTITDQIDQQITELKGEK